MSDARLLQVQAISGLCFLAFVLVHLTNTLTALGGPEAYDGFQRAARTVYQYPAVELLGLGLPLATHVAAAFVRLRRRGFRRPQPSWRARLHRYTGYYLLLVIFGHIAAVRGAPFAFGFLPDFAGVAFSLWWQPWLFYPYYFVFGLCALYHGLHGATIALGALARPLPEAVRTGPAIWLPVGAFAVLLLAALLALGGRLFPIPDPTDNDYARMWERVLGVDFRP